ncbi:Verru_Chthon cassette protein A [Verrucomicrobium sp. BvORR034]|uniref:Verru_Chthon cassette protein A n=1 Tax=Verrucomicrobium sp. BvORR034 TaxID=1396418 RepID=UPI0006793BA0|nr:Verru_Chthon cassette protein A [Verrucomicrobium sp. BvORR034]
MKFFALGAGRRRQGVALVLVLSVVALLMLLVTGFLMMVHSETRASGAYAKGEETRLLAEMPLNIAIAQVRKATENNGTEYTWASQPGMIRRFGQTLDSATQRSRLDRAYKLYSADAMEVGPDASGLSPLVDATKELPADWHARPALFTDLNSPVYTQRDAQGLPADPVYPIVDPRTFEAGVNPAHLTATVDGVVLVKNGSGLERLSTATGALANPLPMPVRWLYVLQNGAILAGEDDGGGKVRLTGASSANTVVGRIAFWTDDETCKVNINTASEGMYWDVPRTSGWVDGDLFANRQPVRNEFNRYPGHPATTCLSAVLDPWIGLGYINQTRLPNYFIPQSGNKKEAGNYADLKPKLETYLKLSPRIVLGPTEGGLNTVNIWQNNTQVALPAVPTPDRDRLYASVDELAFQASRVAQPADSPFTRDTLDRVRFLLTAYSRAPEVNLFNKPRIALWPVQQDGADRNVLDKLIAFCAQTGTSGGGNQRPYYFQRLSVHQKGQSDPSKGHGSALSPSQDWSIERNRELYAYLQALTSHPIPGFGGSFTDKYEEANSRRDQILTEMVDHIRSGLNTYSVQVPSGGPGSETTYCYAPPRAFPGYPTLAAGESQVVPLRVGASTKGFGRCITVTEAALVFYPTSTIAGATDKTKAVPDIKYSVPGSADRWGFAAKEMKAFLLLEFFNPMVGNPSTSPFLAIDVKSGVKVNGQSLAFPVNASNPQMGDVSRVVLKTAIGTGPGAGHNTAHSAMFQPFFQGPYGSVRRDLASSHPDTGFAWHSATPLTVPAPSGTTVPTMTLDGGPLEISIRTPDGSEEIQRVQISFDSAPSIPAPYAYINETNYAGLTVAANKATSQHYVDVRELNLSNRIAGWPNDYFAWLIRPGDCARSMEAAYDARPKGDFRLYAARTEVPAAWFRRSGTYSMNSGAVVWTDAYRNASARFAHGLRHSSDWQYWGHFCSANSAEWNMYLVGGGGSGTLATHPYYRNSSYFIAGSLVKGIGGGPIDNSDQVTYFRDAPPVTARGVDYAARVDGMPGDWDNGLGNVEDGPYVNKPDEDAANLTAGYSNDAGGYYGRAGSSHDSASGDRGINYAPNRQTASAVQFGSLPTGVVPGNAALDRPWETLLFCPNPAGRTSASSNRGLNTDHIGFATPPDHLLLDFFWMPVVEPYPISEPFSTAGKINMNYDIFPFRYIKRRTGLHAVMKRTGMAAIPSSAASYDQPPKPVGWPWFNKTSNYKGGRDHAPYQSRYDINLSAVDGTLAAFERRFGAQGDVFRSASEICSVFLIPQMCPNPYIPYPPEATSRTHLMNADRIMEWWNGDPARADAFELTGDNTREAPYGQIYPRLTTKSNVYQVHYKVQLLGKVRSTDPAVWEEGRDVVTGEQQGAAIFERYLDPADRNMPDLASSAGFGDSKYSVDSYYRYRVVSQRRFVP